MTRLWHALVNWFETADLVPLLVLVSAVHYAAVLSGKDWWPVAVAIGLLVDLGHYRVIRVAVRYSGDSLGQRIARWTIALAMTAVSLNYHQRYYQDWWLSAPLPLLIAALAWLQQVEPRKREDAPSVRIVRQNAPALPSAQERNLLPEIVENATHSAASYACNACGETFTTSTAKASHARWAHKKEPANV